VTEQSDGDTGRAISTANILNQKDILTIVTIPIYANSVMRVGYRGLVPAWNDRHIATLDDTLLDPFNVRLQLDTAELNPDTEIKYPENAP